MTTKRGEGSRERAVYQGLRRAIIEQALLPGTKLPEDTVGDGFGVSRTLARAALARLAAEGLVEIKPNRGAAVASPTLAEARDVFEVRRQLEGLVVERLAGRLSAAQVAELRDHVEREERARPKSGAESIRLAGEFHTLLASFTGNELLKRYVHEVVSRSSLILALYARPHSPECAVNEHTGLIAALVEGDARAARRLMDHHLDAVQDRALLQPQADREQSLKTILAPYAAPAAGP